MNCLPRRWIFKFIKIFIIIWLTVLLYLYFMLTSRDLFGRSSKHQRSIIKELMRVRPSNDSKNVYRPLADIVFPNYDILSFYHLPKRQRGLLFTEITSANRDTSYPLAPDFTFHLGYTQSHVVLYEDYGAGCVHRLYLFPVLPTHADLLYKMTASDLKNSFISFVIDGTKHKYSLEHLMRGEEWPFLKPFNTQHKYLASGMGSYTPFCYSHSMKISYFPSSPLPGNLFETTVNCSIHDLYCPIHIYSSISRIKFPAGTHIESFTENESLYRRRALLAAELLHAPEHHGAATMDGSCQLQCVDICRGCQKIIYSHQGAGVVSSILMRVYSKAGRELHRNWNDILFTATFDGRQNTINQVSLGSLFGFTASLNEFGAAAFGKKKLKCGFHDTLLQLEQNDLTGYLYYPMPFWEKVEFYVNGTSFMPASLLLCFQINIVDNSYLQSDTGYLHMEKTYFSDNVTGYRQILSVSDSWGQVVGVMMEIDNLRSVRGVSLNERWAALQADAVIFIDGVKAASVLGTGLEDYFSYAHGFNMAENTTYAFVGNYHASPRRKEPLTWHCYRLHILDPIYFSKSIEFIMEGTSREHFQTKQHSISYEEYVKRQDNGDSCLSHLVIYYAGDRSDLINTDVLHLSDPDSEASHQFKTVLSSPNADDQFSLRNKRYLAACNKNETFDFTGRVFHKHDRITFTMKTHRQNKGVILRREFHSVPKTLWNELCRVWLNSSDLGVWFIPMGALSEEYCVREEDFAIGEKYTRNKTSLVFTIEPLNDWRDISYRLFTIS